MPAKSLSFAEIWAILEEEGVHPVRDLARIAANNVDCSVCRGIGRTPVQLGENHTVECFRVATAKCKCGAHKHKAACVTDEECTCNHIGSRTCQSCSGTLKEAIAPALMTRALEALTPLIASSLKQVDNTSSDGSMTPKQVFMTIVNSKGETITPTGYSVAPGGGKTPPQLMARNEDE